MAAAVLWTNLTVAATVNSFELAAVWWPGRATVLDHFSGVLRPAEAKPYPFRDGLRRWARERRRTFADARGDDEYFALDRLRAIREATALAADGSPVWFAPRPDTPRPHLYIFRNQLPLYARRPIEMVDPTDGPPPDTSGILVAPVAVAERLLREERPGPAPTLVRRGPRYAVLRFGG
jgi:hypothetical protein